MREGFRAAGTFISKTRNVENRSATRVISAPPPSGGRRRRVDRPSESRRRGSSDVLRSASPVVSKNSTLLPRMVIRRPRPLVLLKVNSSCRWRYVLGLAVPNFCIQKDRLYSSGAVGLLLVVTAAFTSISTGPSSGCFPRYRTRSYPPRRFNVGSRSSLTESPRNSITSRKLDFPDSFGPTRTLSGRRTTETRRRLRKLRVRNSSSGRTVAAYPTGRLRRRLNWSTGR